MRQRNQAENRMKANQRSELRAQIQQIEQRIQDLASALGITEY